MKKSFILSIAALAMAATSFAQEYMVVEGYNGQTARFNVNAIKQVYFLANETHGNGTADNPYNVAAIIEQTANLNNGEFYNDGAEVYVTGIVTETTDISVQYGNATYYISDDAQGSNRFYVYRGKMLNGEAVVSETDIEVGDSVTICGKIKNYKGLNEFDMGNYLTFIKKGKSGGEVTPGTITAPLTVAQALDYIETLGADVQSPEGYVKGKIASISEVSVQYGNATYAISDDGSDENTLLVYRGFSLGGAKFTSEDEIKVGDEVIIMGKFVYFKGNTKEVVQGSTIYSLNGKTAGGDTPAEDVKTVTIAQFKAAEVSNDVWYKLTGTVANLKDGDLYGNFDLVDATDSVYVYGLLSEKGGAKKKFQELVAAKGIKNGSKITIIGNRGEYNGKIEVMNAYFVSIEGGGDVVTGKGSLNDPYNVTEAIAAGSGTGVYVKAYIVGNVTGQVLAEGAHFDTTGDSKTNLLIANSANETDVTNCMPVQLPSGDVRTALNLVDNPDNYKKEIILYGNIEKYYGVTGLKTVTYAILDGNEIGTKPNNGGGETPTDEVITATVAEFNAAAVSTNVWYQLTGTISNLKDGDQYGNFDLEDATGSVYVYGLLSEKGGAKKQFQELVAAKGIANGKKITIIGNRGEYSGKIEVTNAYFVSIE